MDKKTLKGLIIGYRMSGLSFGDIADKLEKEHEYKTSRQNICGIYNRATSDKAVEKDVYLSIITIDICNYYILGLNDKKIASIINSQENKISPQKISSIISDEIEYTREIRDCLVNKLIKLIDDKSSMADIIKATEYKGVKPTNNAFNNLLKDAELEIIDRTIKLKVKELTEITKDNKLSKEILETLPYFLKAQEVKKS